MLVLGQTQGHSTFWKRSSENRSDNMNMFMSVKGMQFPWGAALLSEDKSQGLHSVQLSANSSSLPSVQKDKRSCFSQGKRSAVQLPLDHKLCE